MPNTQHLIDRLAAAAVEHQPAEEIRDVIPDLTRRSDGLFSVPAAAWRAYSEHRPDASREGAFRWFNNLIGDALSHTPETGAALMERRAKINAAIDRGEIY